MVWREWSPSVHSYLWVVLWLVLVWFVFMLVWGNWHKSLGIWEESRLLALNLQPLNTLEFSLSHQSSLLKLNGLYFCCRGCFGCYIKLLYLYFLLLSWFIVWGSLGLVISNQKWTQDTTPHLNSLGDTWVLSTEVCRKLRKWHSGRGHW